MQQYVRSESDDIQRLREQMRQDRASALMEWRALDAEEHAAIAAGAHIRAGRLAGLKHDVTLRLTQQA